MRVVRKARLGMAVMAMLVLWTQVSMAQPGEGRRGRGPGGGFGGPPTPVRLLTLKEVQNALQLTEEQKNKLADINQKLRDDMRAAMDNGSSREEVQKLMGETTAKVNEVLDEGQQKRLLGIFVQVNGANAVLDPGVSKELNVTDDQKKQLEEIRQKNMEAVRELFRGARDQEGGREAVREKADKLREEESKAMLAVLTSPQQEQLEALKGEKVDIDLSQLRGPGGPGGRFGDRARGGGRGARNRNSDNSGNSGS